MFLNCRHAEYKTYQSQCVGDLSDENLERLHALLLAKLVAAIDVQAVLGLLGRQTNFMVDLELSLHIRVAQGMRGRGHGLVGLPRDMRLQTLLLIILLLSLTHGLGMSCDSRENGGTK